MQVLLNIGLDNVPVVGESFTNGVRNPAVVERLFTVIHALRAAGFKVQASKLLQSDTEPTLAARVLFCGHMTDFNQVLHDLSASLQQDCIAVYNPITGQGELIGPRAAKWGPFNPEFFFLLDGTRLQAPVAKAA